MKKYYVSIAIAMTGILLSYCHGSKKAMAPVPKLTYTSDVQAVIAANCTPCHFPSKGGNKKALDTYAAVQENIDDMIRRIELNPADKGFMPFKHPKLSDSTIAIFRKWKSDGMLEK